MSILACLLMAATGAWAQTETDEVPLTPNGENKWTMTMPKGNVKLLVEYEPSFNVTFNTEGLSAEEAAAWKAEPNTNLYQGDQVTITYTGTKRLIGVKAVKKVLARTLAQATAEDLGKIVGADGIIYDTKDAAETAGTTAVAMIAYVGSETGHATYTHGLAIALGNEGKRIPWVTAKTTCEGKDAVPGAAWLLPSRNQWKAMFGAFGGNEGSYTGLDKAVVDAGGVVLSNENSYWSSDSTDDPLDERAYEVDLDRWSDAVTYDTDARYDAEIITRACLVF